MLRMILCLMGAALAGDVFARPVPDLTGTYRVRIVQPTGGRHPADAPNTPPGQILSLVVRGRSWRLANMMSAWAGTYSMKGRAVHFIGTHGPAGKLKKPDTMIFDLSRDGRTLTQRPKRGGEPFFVFVRTSGKPGVSLPLKRRA